MARFGKKPQVAVAVIPAQVGIHTVFGLPKVKKKDGHPIGGGTVISGVYPP